MEMILIIVVLVLLFGGGGYWGRRQHHRTKAFCSGVPGTPVTDWSRTFLGHGYSPQW